MEIHIPKAKTKSISVSLLLTAIILVAFNLRPAITSVGPIVGIIQEDLGLAHWSSGLLTSLPLIAFALISPIVPRIASILKNERTMLLGLIFLAVGIGIRWVSMPIFLYIGTLMIGIGIAVCNVLLPVIIVDKFPRKVGLMTSVYSTSMGIAASLASGISIPLASGMNLGWENALLIWGIPSLLAIVLWGYIVRFKSEKGKGASKIRSRNSQIWKSGLAWQIALFMGFQSFLFYVTIAWLPQILHSKGLSMESAGWMLSFIQLIGLPLSFSVPVLATRFRSQRWMVVVLGLSSVLGFSGLLLNASYPVVIICIVLMGIGLGGTFPLALTFLGIRSRNGKQAAELSGMAQSIGYVLAAIGPLFIGSIFDFTGIWTVPIITLVIVSILLVVCGIFAGRDKYVY